MHIGTLLGSEERQWKLLVQNTLQFLICLKTQHACTYEISTPAAESPFNWLHTTIDYTVLFRTLGDK